MVALHRDDPRTSPPNPLSDRRRGEGATQPRPAAQRGAQPPLEESPGRPAVCRPALHIVPTDDEPMPRVRRDMLPDGADYRDTGCDLAASCLQCPFDRCKYDKHGGGYRLSVEQRDREIALLRRDYEAPLTLLAHTYGVSLRTVKRALRRQGVSRRNKRHARRTPHNAPSHRAARRTRTPATARANARQAVIALA